jgi:hypothetical protein
VPPPSESPVPERGAGVGQRIEVEPVEEFSSARLFASDIRAAFLLFNETRCRAIERVFGVRKDQVNLMTLIAALMLAQAAHRKTEQLRGGLPSPTRGDTALGVGLLNALGNQIAGPASQKTPLLGALLGGIAVGGVSARRLRRSANSMRAVPHTIRVSYAHRYGHQTNPLQSH